MNRKPTDDPGTGVPVGDDRKGGKNRPRTSRPRVFYLLSLLSREIGGFFERLRLTADRAYDGTLHVLLFVIKSARFILDVIRRSWHFLVSLVIQTRDALRRFRLAVVRFYQNVRSFLADFGRASRNLFRKTPTAVREVPQGWAGEQAFLSGSSSERTSKLFRRLRSFLVKEMLDVLQQPRLVITLILGPFLILLIFGLGFTGKQGPATAIVVLPPDARFPLDLEEQLARYKGFMPIHGIVDNREEALQALAARSVEIVAVLPVDSNQTVLSGQQAVIDIHVDEYDPVRTQWLKYVAGFAAEDLNQQLLSMALAEGRSMLSGLQNMSTGLLDRLVEVSEDVEAGDVEEAKLRLDEALIELDDEMERLEPSLQDLLMTEGARESFRTAGRQPGELRVLLARVRAQGAGLRELLEDPEFETSAVFQQIREMRDTVLEVQSLAELLASIPDKVLVAPVATNVLNVSPSEPAHLNFYAPAVLALLLQHMAITFGSLTMVRERLLGAEELFRIAPISPWEILTGKFSGYTLFTVAVGILLSVLLVLAIKIPMLGNVFYFVLTLLLMTTAGLGWGVFVSLFSTRQSQAVQFSMLLLIASVFFGGFFLALSSMLRSIRFVSYALPVTYGVKALREIMLAGRGPGVDTLLPLLGMTVGFYLVSVLVYTWQNKRA